ncbi:DUF1801 domain-containing protein [bacterium]|nr:DUF1801 domain-containing protein [bacterium]
MASQDIDAYIARQDEPKRSTLIALRKTILEIVPDAEECISYGLPAFRIEGKVVAGFGAFKNHLSYLPHSGSVFLQMAEDLTSYSWSSGALQFPIDTPLPKQLVAKLIALKLQQIRAKE